MGEMRGPVDHATTLGRKPYVDLGVAFLDSIDAGRVKTNLVRRLERLGFDVTITQRQPPQPQSEPTDGVLLS